MSRTVLIPAAGAGDSARSSGQQGIIGPVDLPAGLARKSLDHVAPRVSTSLYSLFFSFQTIHFAQVAAAMLSGTAQPSFPANWKHRMHWRVHPSTGMASARHNVATACS